MTLPRDNPFRSARLESLPFCPQDTTWDALLARLATCRYRAAIIGPHGTGKTTLLEQLIPHLQTMNLQPRLLFRNEQAPDVGSGIPRAWRGTLATLDARDVLLVDGYGHLNPLSRRQVKRLARRAAGLVVTGHRPLLTLPTLIRTRSSPALLARLVAQLDPAGPVPDLHALFEQCHGNLREALRTLYDRRAGVESSRA